VLRQTACRSQLNTAKLARREPCTELMSATALSNCETFRSPPLEYARRIARDWNTVEAQSGYARFVTRFEIDDETAKRYPVQAAGGHSHEELWIPADELPQFNARLVGIISVVEAFAGAKFTGSLDPLRLMPADL
jgi:hypothetical protein